MHVAASLTFHTLLLVLPRRLWKVRGCITEVLGSVLERIQKHGLHHILKYRLRLVRIHAHCRQMLTEALHGIAHTLWQHDVTTATTATTIRHVEMNAHSA